MPQLNSVNFFVLVIDMIKQFQGFCIKTSLKSFVVLILIFFVHRLNAQTDTTMVDTVSMAKIDSLTQPEDEDYEDSTEKHIYDTSQYFFNSKDDLTQQYAKEKFLQRHLIDNAVNELKKQDDFWYVPAIEKIESRLKTDAAYRDSLLKAGKEEVTDQNENDFIQKNWFRFVLWFIVIGGFLASVIYFLVQNKINLFTKEATSSSGNAEQDEHENIFELSYNQLIIKAETEQNYRIAVRLLFLQTLKILSDTNHIKYQPDYTNLDYLQQLYQSNLYKQFFKLTHHYEYVWYGKFQISQTQYTVIKNDFLMLQSKIA